MSKQHAIVMWVIWFVFLQSAFIYPFFLGDGVPSGENIDEPMAIWVWFLCFGPLVVATVIRWLVIPAIQNPQTQLTTMIIGISFAESSIFLYIFVMGPEYPQNQLAVFIVAILVLIMMAPSYATPGVSTVKNSLDQS